MDHDPAAPRPADGSLAPPAPTAETTSHPGPAVPAPARHDTNSRVERRIWQLRKGNDRAEARSGLKFGRREFRVYVNGALLWSRNYALDEGAAFDADAAARFDEFVALGWEVPVDPVMAE